MNVLLLSIEQKLQLALTYPLPKLMVKFWLVMEVTAFTVKFASPPAVVTAAPVKKLPPR